MCFPEKLLAFHTSSAKIIDNEHHSPLYRMIEVWENCCNHNMCMWAWWGVNSDFGGVVAIIISTCLFTENENDLSRLAPHSNAQD